MRHPPFFLLGPTAAGKTSLALPLAEALGAEILSLDSMAIYRRMDLGTAKPTPAERARVPHHLIDLVEPWDSFDVARYRAAALAAVDALEAGGKRALFVGGTPLYYMALTRGLFAGPSADPGLRAELLAREESEGPGTLHGLLQRADPDAARRIHPNDLKRVVRALEVVEATGTPLSRLQAQWHGRPPIAHRAAALVRPPGPLRARVRARIQAMLASGLVEETRAILEAGGFSRQAGAALGYAQVLQALAGRVPFEELEQAIELRTWNFVRKQRTWLRKLEGLRWVDPERRPEDPVGALRRAFLDSADPEDGAGPYPGSRAV